VLDPEGDLTQYFFDLNGNQSKIIDPHGDAATWIFDAPDRPVSPVGYASAYRILESGDVGITICP